VANRRGLYGLLGMVLVALGLTLWMDLRLMRALTARLAAATRVATRIAQGRLGEPVEPGHDDEIGRLLQSLDGMDRQLVAVVRQVSERASALDHNATGIAEGNDALSRRTESQALHLERTAGSMARIAASLAEPFEALDLANIVVEEGED
jgi:methyl-accepting chemotaxis protein